MLSLLAEEGAYSSFYAPEEYPITKLLREEIFVQVNLVERSDPNIILNLEHCWTTSTPSPHSFPQWDLIVNGYLVLVLLPGHVTVSSRLKLLLFQVSLQ